MISSNLLSPFPNQVTRRPTSILWLKLYGVSDFGSLVLMLSPTGLVNLRSVSKWLFGIFPKSLQNIKSIYLYLATPNSDIPVPPTKDVALCSDNFTNVSILQSDKSIFLDCGAKLTFICTHSSLVVCFSGLVSVCVLLSTLSFGFPSSLISCILYIVSSLLSSSDNTTSGTEALNPFVDTEYHGLNNAGVEASFI